MHFARIERDVRHRIRGRLRTESGFGLLDAAREGLGFAILPTFLVAQSHDATEQSGRNYLQFTRASCVRIFRAVRGSLHAER